MLWWNTFVKCDSKIKCQYSDTYTFFVSASEINVEKCHIEMFRHVHRYKLKGTINHNILLVKIIYFLFLSFKEILI